jgi:5-(carboxyamino)imidazole ribonucleotide synthase
VKIGVLGGGQLGQMLGGAAADLGFECHFLDPADDPCAALTGPVTRAAFDDVSAIARFASDMDVLTYEFENVPETTVQALLDAGHRVHPSARALHQAQDRLLEKTLFQRLGIPVAPFAAVSSREALDAAVTQLGLPVVLKTRRFGYDGKGQVVIRTLAEVDEAWQQVGRQPAIAEAWVAFDREVSCVAVRAAAGTLGFYPITQNDHVGGILRRSRPINDAPLQALAERHTRAVLEALDYVGVMAFEFFVAGGILLANEIAPRVHNSGHWTLDGAACSQFENHLRAICGLPLGPTARTQPVAMLNLIGAVPDVAALSRWPSQVRVHDYRKAPRHGRKVGHLNLVAVDDAALGALIAAVSPLVAAVTAG